jgi:hypothetical protein
MKQDKQNRIEQVLNAWDGAKRAEAPAYFYTRLKARMLNQQSGDETAKSWLLRPAFVVASLVLVIIINAFIYFQNDNSTISSSYDESIQTIAAEFNLSDNNNLLEDINEDK